MRCSNCGSENSADVAFCVECGARSSVVCGSCAHGNPPRAKFCEQCGAPLGTKASVDTRSGPLQSENRERSAERRHLTVLFSDLVDSTEIASRLDPEEWREVITDYHKAAAEAVARFGGHVAQYLGDGVLVYFGWPEAHEDNAERAARAGLAVVHAMRELNRAFAQRVGLQLAVRVGIHTGSVVVGPESTQGANVFGYTPNIAARVQTAAEPGTVVVTSDTRRLISGLFVIQELGARSLKGIAEPINLYRIVEPTGLRRRIRAAGVQSPTSLVGREQEMRDLWTNWERACEGDGRFQLIVGEAGIGKSRLIEELHGRLSGTPHTWIDLGCSPHFQSTPFYPVVDMFKRAFGWSGEESREERIETLELSLGRTGLPLSEAIPLLAEMLDLPLTEKYQPLLVSPTEKRRRLLATLEQWVLGAGRTQPTVFEAEDLQWADPSTLELVDLLTEGCAGVRLLLLFTARPEFRAPAAMRTHQLVLERLSNLQTRAMVEEIAPSGKLPAELMEAVASRTGGIPFFVEELTRLVIERGGRSARTIPATLADSLTARLDRLGPAKEVAQVGAAIGGEFSYQLISAVHPIEPQQLQAALKRLVDERMLHVMGDPSAPTYRFRHGLLEDAAYEALLKAQRKQLHRRIAQVLYERFPDLAGEHPEVLARHWTNAGETEAALAQWREAGKVARSRNAFREAAQIYRQALEILDTLPPSPGRDERELRLASSLAGVIRITDGFTAPEAIEASARAQTLAEKTGNLWRLAIQLINRWSAPANSGDWLAASALADQALEVARREGGAVSLGLARMAHITNKYWRGDFTGAEEQFACGSDSFASQGFRQYPGATPHTLGTASFNAWTLGLADTARERMREAMAQAGAKQSPFDLAYVNYMRSLLEVLLREPREAASAAEKSLALAEEHGFQQFTTLCRVTLGWARAALGRTREGSALIHEGITSYAAIGGRLGASGYLTYLAAAQAMDGAITQALDTIDMALHANPEERAFRPEALRVRGELRLEQGRTEAAQADFREAIMLARSMNAKSWELRATMSLARMLGSRGEASTASELLGSVYGSFAEGFDKRDLIEAKDLLDQLSAAKQPADR